MRTIVFFARQRLTEFYIKLYEYLKYDYNLIFIAYSKEEESIIKENLNDVKIINFTDKVEENLKLQIIDLELLSWLDTLIYNISNKRFTLNSSLQSDRAFSYLSYKEALHLSQTYYIVWENIFNENKIDFLIHEFVSLHMNHLASILCKKNDAVYVSEMAVKGFDDYNFIFMNYDEGISIELEYEYNKITREEISKNEILISNYKCLFKDTEKVFFSHLNSKRIDYFKMFPRAIKNELKIFLKSPDKILNNVDYFMLYDRSALKKLINLTMYKILIKWDNFDSTEKYYYYSLHLEPEAVVNYMADGIYKNQIKLIENLAAQLPVGTYLYVKDHPHNIGYRNFNDYLRLKKVPNIKLLHAKIPGIEVIKYSIGVISLNGTAGFEAIMKGKKVFTFGKAFYNISPLAIYIENIKDFKNLLEIEYTEEYRESELNKLILALNKCLYIGNTDCFYNAKNDLSEDTQNINQIANSYREYLKKIEKIKEDYK